MASCRAAMAVGGYYGPFFEVGNFYSPVSLTDKQKYNNAIAEKDLGYVEKVLLPNRTKQVEWFSEQVGDLSVLLKGEAFDTCTKQSELGEAAEITLI